MKGENHYGKTFKLEREMLAGRDIMGLYDAIAAALGYDISDESIRYDCRKVCISENIQKMLYETYETENPQAFIENSEQAAFEVARLLLLYGPKADPSLPDNTVRTEDGFVFYEKEEIA